MARQSLVRCMKFEQHLRSPGNWVEGRASKINVPLRVAGDRRCYIGGIGILTSSG